MARLTLTDLELTILASLEGQPKELLEKLSEWISPLTPKDCEAISVRDAQILQQYLFVLAVNPDLFKSATLLLAKVYNRHEESQNRKPSFTKLYLAFIKLFSENNQTVSIALQEETLAALMNLSMLQESIADLAFKICEEIFLMKHKKLCHHILTLLDIAMKKEGSFLIKTRVEDLIFYFFDEILEIVGFTNELSEIITRLGFSHKALSALLKPKTLPADADARARYFAALDGVAPVTLKDKIAGYIFGSTLNFPIQGKLYDKFVEGFMAGDSGFSLSAQVRATVNSEGSNTTLDRTFVDRCAKALANQVARLSNSLADTAIFYQVFEMIATYSRQLITDRNVQNDQMEFFAETLAEVLPGFRMYAAINFCGGLLATHRQDPETRSNFATAFLTSIDERLSRLGDNPFDQILYQYMSDPEYVKERGKRKNQVTVGKDPKRHKASTLESVQSDLTVDPIPPMLEVKIKLTLLRFAALASLENDETGRVMTVLSEWLNPDAKPEVINDDEDEPILLEDCFREGDKHISFTLKREILKALLTLSTVNQYAMQMFFLIFGKIILSKYKDYFPELLQILLNSNYFVIHDRISENHVGSLADEIANLPDSDNTTVFERILNVIQFQTGDMIARQAMEGRKKIKFFSENLAKEMLVPQAKGKSKLLKLTNVCKAFLSPQASEACHHFALTFFQTLLKSYPNIFETMHMDVPALIKGSPYAKEYYFQPGKPVVPKSNFVLHQWKVPVLQSGYTATYGGQAFEFVEKTVPADGWCGFYALHGLEQDVSIQTRQDVSAFIENRFIITLKALSQQNDIREKFLDEMIDFFNESQLFRTTPALDGMDNTLEDKRKLQKELDDLQREVVATNDTLLGGQSLEFRIANLPDNSDYKKNLCEMKTRMDALQQKINTTFSMPEVYETYISYFAQGWASIQSLIQYAKAKNRPLCIWQNNATKGEGNTLTLVEFVGDPLQENMHHIIFKFGHFDILNRKASVNQTSPAAVVQVDANVAQADVNTHSAQKQQRSEFSSRS